jgi:hypothetical protein
MPMRLFTPLRQVRRGGIVPLILDFGVTWSWTVAPPPPPPSPSHFQQETPTPMNRKRRWPHSWAAGRFGRETDLFHPYCDSNPGSSSP